MLIWLSEHSQVLYSLSLIELNISERKKSICWISHIPQVTWAWNNWYTLWYVFLKLPKTRLLTILKTRLLTIASSGLSDFPCARPASLSVTNLLKCWCSFDDFLKWLLTTTLWQPVLPPGWPPLKSPDWFLQSPAHLCPFHCPPLEIGRRFSLEWVGNEDYLNVYSVHLSWVLLILVVIGTMVVIWSYVVLNVNPNIRHGEHTQTHRPQLHLGPHLDQRHSRSH